MVQKGQRYGTGKNKLHTQIYTKQGKEKYEHRRFELKVAMNIKIKIYVLRSVLRTITIV